MTPYYDDGTCVIYHGDCRDVLPSLSSIDLVLTSPPYNLAEGGDRRTSGIHFPIAAGYDTHDDAMPHPEYVSWQRDVLRLCWATLTDAGAILYNHKPRVRGNRVWLPLELIPNDLPLRQIITWDRGSGFNRRFTYFVPSYEWLLLIAKEKFRTTTLSVDDVWRIPFETGSEHPAPFPLRLARQAIHSTAATIVCDPFVGSGTTLRAAKDLGRRSIGIDISERYCEIAARRLAQEVLPLEAS